MSCEQIRYSVLGPVRAWLPGAEIELGSPRQRTVLAALLLELNRPVSLASIIDAVWGQEPLRDARNCVYTYVSRLRRAMRLAEAPRGKRSVLFSTKAGYQLSGDPGLVDAVTSERRCATARDCYRRGDKQGAAEAINGAISLWGGEPFGGLAGPGIEAERVRLAELRIAALELLAEIRLDGAGAAEVVAELSALVREYPLRERLRELLMLALYRAGRQGDALRAFQDLRAVLTEDLGVEPGPAIQQLHQRILAADPGLSIADEAGPHPAVPVPHQLPAVTPNFVGRDTQLHQLNQLLANAGGNGGTVVISAINGTAGIGKTALALHWAHQTAGQFPGGELYLNMRGFHRRQGRSSERVAAWRTALIAAERAGELDALRFAHLHLGAGNSAQGSHSDAFAHLGQALTLAEDAADVSEQGPYP
jgi:DNA-binding SARP family transcriptional activator